MCYVGLFIKLVSGGIWMLSPPKTGKIWVPLLRMARPGCPPPKQKSPPDLTNCNC